MIISAIIIAKYIKGIIILSNNTIIKDKININIHGSIARIGGTVNQMLLYKDCIVTDLNIKNLKKELYGETLFGSIRYMFDILEQEIRFYRKGWAAVRDRKSIWCNIHDTLTLNKYSNKFDSVISSNVLEHSYNVIFFLLNTWLITKKDGWQFHTIPCNRYTFDKYRDTTKLEHFISDFEKGLVVEDIKDAKIHFEDFKQSANKDGWSVDDKESCMPFLHYHVFDEVNTQELISYMFEDVTTDLLIEKDKYNDVIVIFKNKLREEFIAKYYTLVKEMYGIELTI